MLKFLKICFGIFSLLVPLAVFSVAYAHILPTGPQNSRGEAGFFLGSFSVADAVAGNLTNSLSPIDG